MTRDEDRVPVQRFATAAAIDLIALTLVICIFVAGSSLLGYLWGTP